MIKLSKKDFEAVFETFKNIQFEINYRNGKLQLPYSTEIFSNCWKLFKLTSKQMNQIIDYCLKDENNEYDVLRLCALFSEQHLLKRTIPIESYEYFLQKFSTFSNDRYQDVYGHVIYMPALTYEDPKDIDPTGKIFELSRKYLSDFKISDIGVLRRFINALVDKEDTYRGYQNIVSFNEFVNELSTLIPINPDDFKLEDDVENYLWKEEQ